MASPDSAYEGGRAEPTRRLFFALWPDESMQAALADATRAVVDASHGVAIPLEKFHFTLAFLGSVPERRIAELREIAARVAAAFQASAAVGGGSGSSGEGGAGSESRGALITVTLDRIEYWRKAQILCATSTSESAAAVALAASLTSALTTNGFAPDLKPFRAHATLARKVRRVTRERDMPPVRWSFRDFRLVESLTEPAGTIYSSREIWPLYAASR